MLAIFTLAWREFECMFVYRCPCSLIGQTGNTEHDKKETTHANALAEFGDTFDR